MKIQVNGLSVAYDIAGSSGEWVTLSHAHCCNRETWQALRQQLSTHYRVLTFDARGHGDTSSTPPPYTMAGLADDAFQLLQALGIHRTHWVGQAMGGLDLNQRIQEIPSDTRRDGASEPFPNYPLIAGCLARCIAHGESGAAGAI